MRVILSTRNPSKAQQIQTLFSDSRVKVLTLSDIGVEGEAVEDGLTLDENALKKAMFAHERSGGLASMADDTGIFIDALNGLPGVRSARWAGETATTDEITAYTLKQLENAKNRSATFETVVAIVLPGNKKYFFSGKVRGHLLEAPRVRPHPKMPYSPLFVPEEGKGMTWAEMTTEFENEISHRGKAFRLARAFLESQFSKPRWPR